jgi:hypothetical protein
MVSEHLTLYRLSLLQSAVGSVERVLLMLETQQWLAERDARAC